MSFVNRLTLPLLFLSSTLSAHAEMIVGGHEVIAADVHAISTVALLTVTPRGVSICTGSIISNDMLVTAAHCVSDMLGRAYPGDQIYAVFNVDVMVGIGERRKVIAAMPHPKYQGVRARGNDQHDIALVRFPGGIPEGYKIASILPHAIPLPKGTSTTLVGYGVNEQDPLKGGTGSGTLRKVTVKIQDAKFAKTEVLIDQREGKGACHGDSGGPAIVKVRGKNYVWGVTNRGFPEEAPDDCKHFSVYTRITAHQGFLKEAAQLLQHLK